MKFTSILVIALASVFLAGCPQEDSTDVEKRQQEQASMRAGEVVGFPSVPKYSEKKMMKDIIEKRDQAVPTITYLVGMNNELKFLCNSVGYGLPYATQFTNPMKLAFNISSSTALPQADPNGLFSPSSADGTWVYCLNPETKLATVVYIEPRIIVSPFALK